MKLVAAGGDFSGANVFGANIAGDRFWPRPPRLLGQ
jgi:hypothetical protein